MRKSTRGLRAVTDTMGPLLGQSIAQALRKVHPKDTAKRVAQDIGADLRTVERWLAGHTPQMGPFGKMATVYGARFVGFVLAPCGDWAEQLRMEAELDQRISEAEAALEEIKQRRETAKGRQPS